MIAHQQERFHSSLADAEPVGARSPEDGDWLTRHGYPTERELEGAVLDGDLPAGTAPGTVSDMVEAERMLVNEGTREGAVQALEHGAEQGSIYALIALGIFYEDIDPARAHGYFRAAVMRGDWMVALRPPLRPLDQLEDALASMYALELLERFDARRALRGLPPLRRQIRPGLDDFILSMRAMHAERAFIEELERGD